MTDPPATVFIVDDDETVRTGLHRLLRSAGIRNETFGSAGEFLARPFFEGVACLILDVRMPDIAGTDLQVRLQQNDIHYPVIFLTAHGDLSTGIQAMKRGAEDFLTKPVDEEVLLEAVQRCLARHEKKLRLARRIESARERLAGLSPREGDVLRCLITGAMNKQIAAHLGIVEDTVKVHRARILHKAGVSSIAELVRLCAVAGIKPEAME